MNRFITRVELHNATWPDYENLHAFMAAVKFHRTIVGDDGITYRLPTATYSSHGLLSSADVYALALNASARTGKRAWVLVTEFNSSYWLLERESASLPRAPSAVNALAALFPAANALSPLARALLK